MAYDLQNNDGCQYGAHVRMCACVHTHTQCFLLGLSILAFEVPFCCDIITFKGLPVLWLLYPVFLGDHFYIITNLFVLCMGIIWLCNCLFVLFPTMWEPQTCYNCDTAFSQIVFLFFYFLLTFISSSWSWSSQQLVCV